MRALRSPLLPALLALLALAGCTRTEAARVHQPARHVLLIVVDTLRADRVGAFGGASDASLCMDQLARRGVRFERASAQCSWTSPSMVSLLTGRYLAGRRLTIPEATPTIAERFREHGFGTAAFVTNPLLSEQHGFARGFDQFHVLQRRKSDARVGDWLRARAGQPTFTYVHFSHPHEPYQPLASFVKRPRVPLDEEVRRAYEAGAREHGLADIAPEMVAIEELLALYEGEVRWADRAIAEVLFELEEAGELDDACIVITADHGEGLWTRADTLPFMHMRLGNGEALELTTIFKQGHGGQLHEELIRVPLIVVAPGLPRGVVVDVLVENVDLAPTLLELAGLPPPRDTDGRSLVGAVLEPAAWPKTEAFSMTRYVRGLTTEAGLKLMLPTDFGARFAGMVPELYDLRADPGERTNLAAERPELVRELSARIERIAARGLPADDPVTQADVERHFDVLRALGYVGSTDDPITPVGLEAAALEPLSPTAGDER